MFKKAQDTALRQQGGLSRRVKLKLYKNVNSI
jgi:hypothetical protein